MANGERYDGQISKIFEHNKNIESTQRLFIEYNAKNPETSLMTVDEAIDNIELLAGIDYDSKDRFIPLTNDIIQKHCEICNQLNIPYFKVQLIGKESSKYKKLQKFKIIKKYCNKKAKDIIRNFGNKMEYNNAEWANFISRLHNKGIVYATTEVIEHPSLSFMAIMSSEHNGDKNELYKGTYNTGYGSECYLTDIDIIVYKNNNLKALLEFKGENNKSEKTLQDCVYYKMVNTLKCKGYKIKYVESKFVLQKDYVKEHIDDNVKLDNNMNELLNLLLN